MTRTPRKFLLAIARADVGTPEIGDTRRYLLVPEFLNVEQPTLGPDVSFPQILHSIHNGGSDSPCNSVVV